MIDAIVRKTRARQHPVVAGWVNYYGHFYGSRLTNLLARLNAHIVRWAGHK